MTQLQHNKRGAINLPVKLRLQTVIRASADAFLHILLCDEQRKDRAANNRVKSSNFNKDYHHIMD